MKYLVSALVVTLATSTIAWSAEVATTDGRFRLGVEGGPGPGNGVSAIVSGRAGAFGFSNTADASRDGLRFTNPPLAGAWTLSQTGFDISYDESPFGPPIAHASLGTGGITEGVDDAGRLTGLGWPGPGWYDHVNFLNFSRGQPNKGAAENAGSFGGIGPEWLTPSFGWTTISQAWAADDSQTLVTVLTNDASGATVTITDVVDPVEDLIARNFRIEGSAGPFAYYANMNPTTSRVPRGPSVTDGVGDHVGDFATMYDVESSVMLHFRPYKADVVPLTTLVTSHEGLAHAQDAVTGAFGPGVYIAIGGQGIAEEHQAGLAPAGLIRAEAEDTPLLDPYYDLSDGRLSGSDRAFGKTAGALRGLARDLDGSYTIYLAAAETASEAIAIVEDARARGFSAIRAASEAWWRDWLTPARLPATGDTQTLAVARHALMLIRTAMDRRTGAIVANATVQTPYRQDWVRDGAFFNYALLLAGYPELARQHADFYRRVYRPGGTWDSIYYADGGEAGFVFPYEIDSQAFALWALWLPAAFETDADARRAYLERVYPAISDTADALLLCRDPINGMQCYAQEDDVVQPTQGAQGASTVYLALRSATAAAEALGVAPNPRWEARADELKVAALEKLCGSTECQGGRGGVYLVWPSRLLPDADPALTQTHLEQYATELDAESSFASPEIGGYLQYPMEPILALAPTWAAPDREVRLESWMRWLTHDLVEPGVLHYGERIFRVGERQYLHAIGFPHIWSGVETYIAAAFVHGLTGCPAGEKIGEAACKE